MKAKSAGPLLNKEMNVFNFSIAIDIMKSATSAGSLTFSEPEAKSIINNLSKFSEFSPQKVKILISVKKEFTESNLNNKLESFF